MRNKFENWNLFKGKGLILELIFGVDKSLTFKKKLLLIYTLHFLTLLVFSVEVCSLQEAIQYLFPSGLFDKSSRPKFKVTISFRQLFNNWINWSILDWLLEKTEKSLFYHFQFPWYMYIVFNNVSDSVIFHHMFSYC